MDALEAILAHRKISLPLTHPRVGKIDDTTLPLMLSFSLEYYHIEIIDGIINMQQCLRTLHRSWKGGVAVRIYALGDAKDKEDQRSREAKEGI